MVALPNWLASHREKNRARFARSEYRSNWGFCDADPPAVADRGLGRAGHGLRGIACRCQRLDMGFELGPAREAVLARDCVLSVCQLRIRDADLQFA